jgi:hypothetical protein
VGTDLVPYDMSDGDIGRCELKKLNIDRNEMQA